MDEYIAIAKEKHGYNMEQVTELLVRSGLGAATRCGVGGHSGTAWGLRARSRGGWRVAGDGAPHGPQGGGGRGADAVAVPWRPSVVCLTQAATLGLSPFHSACFEPPSGVSLAEASFTVVRRLSQPRF